MALAPPTTTTPCFRTFQVSPTDSRLFLRPTKREESSMLGLKSESKPNHRPPPPNSVCLTPTTLSASERLASLVSEFHALSEPIDRVKRLLHYASILPGFEESARVDTNRVTGCTTQVWLDVGLEEPSYCCGRVRMRFQADSDSEITKGFCSCLIWVLDGAEPEEVLAVRSEDLGPMNMGVVAHSRVNTWHNVLISMQRRTRGLLMTDEMPDPENHHRYVNEHHKRR